MEQNKTYTNLSRELTKEQAEERFPGKSDFAILHAHSVYSMLDGVGTPEAYFEECAKRKWPAMAMTEHGIMNSIPDCYLAGKEFKVKYICGNEIYLNDFELLRQKEIEKNGSYNAAKMKIENPDLASRIGRNRHLTVLCKNMVGYQNLLKINRVAWEQGYYYKPRAWFDLLAKHKEGLIILSGCLNGPVCHELRNGNINSKDHIVGAIDQIKRYKAVFGENYYVELQMPGIDGDVDVFEQLCAMADLKKIKTVMCTDTHYVDRKDYILQKIMMAVAQETTIDDPELFYSNSDEQYMKTRAELRATFSLNGYADRVPISLFETSCDNTLEIADKCDGFKPNLEPKLPNIDDARNKLIRATYKGLKEKGLDKVTDKFVVDGRSVTYREQIEIELNRFIEKGFESYFLITQDLICHSRERGFPVGPGRGSCGGSLVCFCLNIMDLDPLLWGLSFDRFLSPNRGGYMLQVQM